MNEIFRLTKLSEPGWERDFFTEDGARKELFKRICSMCQRGDEFVSDDGEVLHKDAPVDKNSSIYDLLATPCGCEYDFEIL